MKYLIIAISSLFLISTITIASDSVKLLELPEESIETLDIDCGAGFLKVTGIENLDKIEVKAEIELDIHDVEDREEFIRDRVRLSLEKRGSRAVLISHVKNSSFFRRSAHINLTVRIPQNMDLNVEDGSGFIEIETVAGDIMIDDGSGSIDLENITGDVEIDDGSGEMDLENIIGNVEIDDGSGEIDIEKIDGDLYVDDGSGTLRISEISGNVVVRDGSGSIYIDSVDKDVNIKEAGSGGLSIRNVKGRVTKKD